MSDVEYADVCENDDYDYSAIGTKVDAPKSEKERAWEEALKLSRELHSNRKPMANASGFPIT